MARRRRYRKDNRNRVHEGAWLSSGRVFKQILEDYGEAAAKAGKEAVKRGADTVVKDAKSRCPVHSGALRDSIHSEPRENGAYQHIVADAKDKNGYYYGKIVEFSPKIKKKFMYPAIDANKAAIREDIIESARKAVRALGR